MEQELTLLVEAVRKAGAKVREEREVGVADAEEASAILERTS